MYLEAHQLERLISYIPKSDSELRTAVQYELTYRTRDRSPLDTSQLSALLDLLLYYVLNKMPSDLVKVHDEQWFFVNPQGHAQWNWRNSEDPLRSLAKDRGWLEAYINTDAYKLRAITNSVKKRKDVKAIKAKATRRSVSDLRL